MVIALGRQVVAPPSVTPLRFGLLSAATQVTDGDSHWEAGVEFQPDACVRANSTGARCDIGVTASPTQTGRTIMAADPFSVYAWIRCSPVGNYDQYQAITDAALTNGEARAVEHTFWTGNVDDADFGGQIFPHLAEDTAVVSNGITTQLAASVVATGAVDIVEAFGLVEGALASCYGSEGVIHVPRAALSHISAWNLAEADGQQLRTLGGNLVAAYSSNDKTSPAGSDASAGNGWIYATGAVNYRRTEIRHLSGTAEALDRSENTMVYISSRTYAIGWDCCLIAAQIALTGV